MECTQIVAALQEDDAPQAPTKIVCIPKQSLKSRSSATTLPQQSIEHKNVYNE